MRSKLEALERVLEEDVRHNGIELPEQPGSKETRVKAEEELVKVCEKLVQPEPRPMHILLSEDADKEYGYYGKSAAWSAAKSWTSPWALIAETFPDAIWRLEWWTGGDSYSDRRALSRDTNEFPGESVYCFRQHGSKRARLFVREADSVAWVKNL